MPADMSPGAKAVWGHIVPLLAQDPNLLSIVDRSVLRDFCEVECQKTEIEGAMWEEAEAAAKAAPRGGKRIARAAVLKDPRTQRTLDSLRMRQVVLRSSIGLTPAARSSLKVGPIITTKTLQTDDVMEDAFVNSPLRPM